MIINFGIHPIWEDRYEIITNTLDKNGMLEWGQNGGIIFLRFDTVWAVTGKFKASDIVSKGLNHISTMSD
jgi:hypothetical protein